MKLGLYRAVLKYFRGQAVISIIIATLLSTITRLIAQRWLYGDFTNSTSGKKILIYGAGGAGSQLATVLKADPAYSLTGFIDDDASLNGWNVLGLTVFSPHQLENIIQEKRTHLFTLIFLLRWKKSCEKKAV